MVGEKLTKKLLWIDDDVGVIGSLTDIVEEAGSTVVKVDSLAKGAVSIERADYGLILLGLIYPSDKWTRRYAKGTYYPETDLVKYPGADFIKYIRNGRVSTRNKGTPIGLLTVVDLNADRNADLKQLIEKDVAFYCRKPTLPRELFEAAKQYLR